MCARTCIAKRFQKLWLLSAGPACVPSAALRTRTKVFCQNFARESSEVRVSEKRDDNVPQWGHSHPVGGSSPANNWLAALRWIRRYLDQLLRKQPPCVEQTDEQTDVQLYILQHQPFMLCRCNTMGTNIEDTMSQKSTPQLSHQPATIAAIPVGTRNGAHIVILSACLKTYVLCTCPAVHMCAGCRSCM